eukprot:CAMPEP_0203683320 /NCGR_PEP_ID=MMETSP0090-20130426/47461_1 /ASSEMBLY_ACC=CAM_ASM_001088 /TAXON_ID=426623 /ORGANISM="Chaetoceros affinis, Strain CCMP159" /LENGTH=350 /DNA_ID=CAMNT_0050552463 /DNA_START=200 /DNA_END=1252 /DNA_ORIENTATION=+
MATPFARLGQLKQEPSASTSSNVVPEVPPFSLDKERYDQNTYLGRYRRMLDIVDPRTLLYTNAEIETARSLLNTFRSNPKSLPTTTTDEQLWHAKKLVNAAIHPDTNEFIPRQFRMSGFVPFNGPVIVGALVAKTTPTALFFHWMNQTHNALVNYNNRNASNYIPMETFAQGYLAAVSSAMGVTFGLRTVIPKVLKPARAAVVMRFTGLPSVMTAAALNVTLMRRGELETGIVLVDDAGREYGSSKVAAEKALKEMIFSRIVLPFSTFCFPPLVASIIESKTTLMKGRPRVSLAINASLLVLGFGFGLPAAIAIFPQNGTISVDELEPEFRELVDDNGKRIEMLQYNKGL